MILIILMLFTKFLFFGQTDSKINNIEKNIIDLEIENPNSNNNSNKEQRITPYVFNVKFHLVKNDDGTGDTQNIGEDQMMNAMRILNTTFNLSKIYFKYRGFDEMRSTTYNNLDANWCSGNTCPINTFGQLISESFSTVFPPNSNTIYSYTAINIFIVSNMYEYNTSNPRVGVQSQGCIAITDDYFLTNILVREMAHYFMLKNIEDIGPYYQPPYNTPCELVNGTNGYTAGGGVADTPATPWPLTISNFGANCTYVSTGGPNSLDCTGVPYINVPLNNFMIDVVNSCNTLGPNYEPIAGRGQFTNGQFYKMRAKIKEFVVLPGVTTPIENAMTTVASLYQPYEVATLQNGTKQHKFQKGFTYRFASINQTALPAYNATTSVVPIIPNISADYYVRIYQVDTLLYAMDYVLVSSNFIVPTLVAPILQNPLVAEKLISNSQIENYPISTKILNSTEISKFKKNLKTQKN